MRYPAFTLLLLTALNVCAVETCLFSISFFIFKLSISWKGTPAVHGSYDTISLCNTVYPDNRASSGNIISEGRE